MKTKLPDPLPYNDGFSLHLYCDHDNDKHGYSEFPHEFVGQTFAGTARQARRLGWIIHRDRTATCPKCSGK